MATRDKSPPLFSDDGKKKAEAFLARMRTADDVTSAQGTFGTIESHATATLDESAFRYLLSSQKIVQMKSTDMSPYFNAVISATGQSSADGNPDHSFSPPVYVVPGIGMGQHTFQPVEIITASGPTTIILANEGSHSFDAAYAQARLLPSDADIATNPSYQSSSAVAMGIDKLPPLQKHRFDEIVAMLAGAAAKYGIRTPDLLISDADQPPGVLHSKEGKNYLVLSKHSLQAALASDDAKKQVMADLDTASHSVKFGAGTAKDLVKKNDIRNFNYEISQRNAGDLPGSALKVSNAALTQMESDGALMRINRSDLNLEAPYNFTLFANTQLPIYVATGIGTQAAASPEVQAMKTREGNRFLLINEGYHAWSPAYVKKMLMESDASVAANITSGRITQPGDFKRQLGGEGGESAQFIRRFGELEDFIVQKSKDEGITNLQLLISNESIGDGKTQVGSSQSREGTNHIYITRDELLAHLQNDSGLESLKGQIGHEMLRHIKDGDNTPEGVIMRRNIAVARYTEVMADLKGAGPAGSGNPEAYAAWINDELIKDARAYIAKYPQESASGTAARLYPGTDLPADVVEKMSRLNLQGDPQHPSDLDRIQALRDEASRMKEYERTHAIPADAGALRAYRQVEANTVIAQVLSDMKNQWDAPIQVPESPPQNTSPFTPAVFPNKLPAQQEPLINGIRTSMIRVLKTPLDLQKAPEVASARPVAIQK